MLKLLCALLVLAACAPLGAVPATELTNPGFEAAADGDKLPDGWRTFVTFPGHAQVAIDRKVKRAGEASLRVEMSDKSRCAISQLISVPQPGAYTFGCEVRIAPTALIPVQVQIEWFQAVNWPQQVRLVRTDTPSPAVNEAADWTQIGATGSKPPEADLALVVVIIGNGQTPAGTAWVDEARWRPGAFPAPLVSNPGFEFDTDKDGQPDGWGKATYGPGWDLARDDTVAHGGKASIRLTGAADHGDRSAYVQATPVFTPPNRVRLSFWYKGTGAPSLIMHLLTPAGVEKPGGGIEYAVMTATPPPGNEWQQFSQEIAVPAEAKQAGIMRVDIILYQKGEGALWYDDVSLDLLE